MNSERRRLTTFELAAIAWSLLAICASTAGAQGVLLSEDDGFRLPRPGGDQVRTSYSIRELSIDASIKNQIATTQVTQVFQNNSNQQIQASFVFPLPYDGAVEQMTFLVDGKEYEAKLLKADDARRIYEGYVRRNQDPALLEWMGTGMFRTSVFPIPANASRTVTLKYTQLLRRDQRLTDYVFPLSTARYTSQPIEKVSLRVAIESQEDLRSIYSPTHNIEISRDDDKHAVVRHSASQTVPANDFRLVFDTSGEKIAASMMSVWPEGDDQGYFVLLASPEISNKEQELISKTVVFVVDKSGSMSGNKIDQAREAARFVVNNLRKDDLFNIISYENGVDTMAPELVRFNDESRPGAIGAVNSITSGGGTNIDGAIKAAMGMIQSSDQPAYIVFLTDGLPTVGETDEMKIASNCQTGNRFGARLISFGVGYDVNSRLLDRLTRENHGQSEYVRPDEDIEASVARLFSKITSPVLSDMTVDFEFDTSKPEAGKAVDRVYPKGVTDMFAGSQVVLIGRYRQAGPVRVRIKGNVGKASEEFKFNVELAEKGASRDYGFVPQLWAARRIGEIIDLIDMNGQNSELVNELVELSTKYGIVTPYTSFLADENSALAGLSDRTRNFGFAAGNLEALRETGGESGFAQRSNKQGFRVAENLELAQSASDSAVPMPASGAGGGLGGGGLSGRGGGSGGSADVGGQLDLGFNQNSFGSAVEDGNRSNAGQRSPGSQGVRKVGTMTLYVRGKDLVADNAADVDLEKDKAAIVEIKRYTDEYFKLVKDNTSAENLILAEQREDETLIVKLRGKTYRIK